VFVALFWGQRACKHARLRRCEDCSAVREKAGHCGILVSESAAGFVGSSLARLEVRAAWLPRSSSLDPLGMSGLHQTTGFCILLTKRWRTCSGARHDLFALAPGLVEAADWKLHRRGMLRAFLRGSTRDRLAKAGCQGSSCGCSGPLTTLCLRHFGGGGDPLRRCGGRGREQWLFLGQRVYETAGCPRRGC
jgi:hypothetical protein